MPIFQSACSLDCWDVCSMKVTVENNQVLQVTGDPRDRITQGFLCQKGGAIAERFQHPDRLKHPMKRHGESWETISWTQALDEISLKLKQLLADHGPTAMIHYSEGGHGGLSKNIDTAFFNALGGVTTPVGSLCLGAGMAAQKLDFGNSYSHPPEDLTNSHCLVLWGRNPAATNIHLVPFIKKLRERQVPVFLIDPVKSASASLADEHLALRPGSDGHLALALAKLLKEKQLLDMSYLRRHCQGAGAFLDQLEQFSMESLIVATGLNIDQVHRLADTYGQAPSAAIYLGYGVQRNRFGGRNVRLIDALGAITGNLGVPGGGVNYAHRHTSQWIDHDYLENTPATTGRTFPRSRFAAFINSHPSPAVQGILVTRGNPVVQLPDTNATLAAFRQIPFKVVIDHFMTDTAQQADYVLPATMILEESDVVFGSMWHNQLTWTEQAVTPPADVRHEFTIFHELARRLELKDFLDRYPNVDTYLSTAVAPLCRYLNIPPDDLKGKRITVPGRELPWDKGVFETQSGLFEFLKPEDPDAFFLASPHQPDYPYHLLTVHASSSLHTQHLRTQPAHQLPEVRIHPNTAETNGVIEGANLYLESANGSLAVRFRLDDRVRHDTMVMNQGSWLRQGAVNHLTDAGLSDLGMQAIYYDCRCRIVKTPAPQPVSF
ncbi:molybdopterin-dependent oxidoreductase [Anoxynatronum buryatiense]|uniref:Anaerobic selenocysteine-containing dehydrogenase n=1 Tax=Anoxynatronum buryatiense TaxID=489973 RepID=A0AA45WY00_9CLOT|nr:molybdopterin-dependent oxidoreductase [Anoxynatronum buryatiense]SMP66522.1 Anaerobic selenocysteine-containing dehydrogenase [Anoxynatronum buryatiense]